MRHLCFRQPAIAGSALILSLGVVTGCAAPEGSSFGTSTPSVTVAATPTKTATPTATATESTPASPTRTSTPTPTFDPGSSSPTTSASATKTTATSTTTATTGFVAFDGRLDTSRSTDAAVSGLTEPITLSMTSQGDLSGKGSCNQYTAVASGKPTALKITKIASTRKACADTVMDEENTYFDVLRSVEAVELTEDYVTFMTAGGKEVVFHRAKSS